MLRRDMQLFVACSNSEGQISTRNNEQNNTVKCACFTSLPSYRLFCYPDSSKLVSKLKCFCNVIAIVLLRNKVQRVFKDAPNFGYGSFVKHCLMFIIFGTHSHHTLEMVFSCIQFYLFNLPLKCSDENENSASQASDDTFVFQQESAPAHRSRKTVPLAETPEFISPDLWPPNSLDLNLFGYKIRGD